MRKDRQSRLHQFSVTTRVKPESAIETPRRGAPITWGRDNNYPQYLENLTKISPSHSTVIEKYINLISGGGWGYDTDNSSLVEFFNNSDDSINDLNDLLIQMSRETIIYGGVCLKIYWNRTKTQVSRIEVIPNKWLRFITPDTLRVEDISEIAVCEDWVNKSRFPIDVYTKFDPSSEEKIQWYWIGDKTTFYPQPKYLCAEAEIITEGKISKYYLRTISNGFAMGKLITFVDGVPDEETRQDLIHDFKANLESEERAGTNLFWFADSKEQVPIIQSVQEDNLDKKYQDLLDKLEKNIMKAHGIINPALYGIRVQSGLGSGKELIDSLAIEQAVNIAPIQKEFSDHMNYLLSFGREGEMRILPFTIEVQKSIELPEIINILTNALLSISVKEQLLRMGGLNDTEIQSLLVSATNNNPNE